MRNPLRIPRVLKDTAYAIQTSVPHAQQAAEADREVLELVRELRDQRSSLSEEERAAVQRRVETLREQARREKEAAERPYEQLSARHPDWVDY